jgi:Fic family protein
MKIPEAAPDWTKIKVEELSFSEELSETIRRGNRDYLYWDRFKYLVPAGTNPEHAWAVLRVLREMNMKPIPLRGPHGGLFKYWLPDCALEYLHEIDQDAGGVIVTEHPSLYASEKRWYLMKSIVEEAIASSQIEGAVTTRKVAKEMFDTGRKPKDRSEQMIFNNYLTISKIKTLTGQPLRGELLKDLQGSMTRDTLDDPRHSGRFRLQEDEPVRIYDYEGTILHDPPAPDKLDELINDLCDFSNGEGKEFIHPVVKAIILHFWLAYIHPFNDGNGRTARALFYWYMLKNRHWLFEYLSISRVIVKTRNQYYRSFLYSEIDSGDMTYFIVYHLRAISAAIKEFKRYIERKQRELSYATLQWPNYPSLNYRQKDVLKKALEDKALTFSLKSHMQRYDVVHQTARTDFLELCEAGFLDRYKQGKTLYFVAAADIERKLQKSFP